MTRYQIFHSKYRNVSFCGLISILQVLNASCKDDSTPPEVVDKLRALGVSQSPSKVIPGQSVSLKFFLAGPSGIKITPSILSDDTARYSLPIVVNQSSPNIEETAVGPLSYYTFDAEYTAPSNTLVQGLLLKSQFIKLRYAVKFSSSNEEELIVGDSLLYAAINEQDQAESPTVNLIRPEATVSGGDVTLEANIENSTSQNYRVSWFVSSGRVKNRRALTTDWQSPNSGNGTVFLTIRDLKSGFFALKTKAVQINGD